MLNAEILKKVIVRIGSGSILTDTCLEYYPAGMMLVGLKLGKGTIIVIIVGVTTKTKKIKETTTERLLWHE